MRAGEGALVAAGGHQAVAAARAAASWAAGGLGREAHREARGVRRVAVASDMHGT